MKLLTDKQRAKLLDNGRRQVPVKGTQEELDFWPVVKLFTPDAQCTWLLTEIDAECDDVARGLCDLGMGFPEFGTVSLAEIGALRGHLGLPVERDLHWTPKGPISAYIDAASAARRIVDLPDELSGLPPTGPDSDGDAS